MNDRKESEEGRMLVKTACEEMARYVCGVSLLLTLIPIQLARRSADRLNRLTKENFERNGNTIKYLKSPSVERNETPAIFSFKLIDNEHSFRTKLHPNR